MCQIRTSSKLRLCCSTRTGAYVVAGISVVCSIILIALGIGGTYFLETTIEWVRPNKYVPRERILFWYLGLVGGQLALSLVKLIAVDALLIVGLNKKKSILVLPWLVVTFLTTIFVGIPALVASIVIGITLMGSRANVDEWIGVVIVIAGPAFAILHHYCWKVVQTEWKNIKALEPTPPAPSEDTSNKGNFFTRRLTQVGCGCFKGTIQTGAQVVAILDLSAILSGIVLVSASIPFFSSHHDCGYNCAFSFERYYAFIMSLTPVTYQCIATLVITVIKLPINALLLKGLVDRKSKWIQPWLIIGMIHLLGSAIGFLRVTATLAYFASLDDSDIMYIMNNFRTAVSGFTASFISVSMVSMSLYYYCWKIVQSDWMNIRDRENSLKDGIELVNDTNDDPMQQICTTCEPKWHLTLKVTFDDQNYTEATKRATNKTKTIEKYVVRACQKPFQSQKFSKKMNLTNDTKTLELAKSV